MTEDELIALDKQHCWHPFTVQQEWCAEQFRPIILESGSGVWLQDTAGQRYLDLNSSIWTNIHGHAHPYINAALQNQMQQLAHSSFLGYSNVPAIKLAAKLVSYFAPNTLSRVFFSDDGSTAVECALRMCLQYWQQSGQPERNVFVAFDNCYHGDTLGAAGLGGVSTFFKRLKSWGFECVHVKDLQELRTLEASVCQRVAALVIEPVVQGVNQMHVWSKDTLPQIDAWAKAAGCKLIYDEVMSGFGRSGYMFGCLESGVLPDFLCLAKGLSGGYLPLAATLCREEIYAAFLGKREELKTFFYGHSFTANPLGCSAALANLELFEIQNTLQNVQQRAAQLAGGIELLRRRYAELIVDWRQLGLIGGLQLCSSEQSGANGRAMCELLMQQGLATRPVMDTIVIMPPLCISAAEMQFVLQGLEQALEAFARQS